jgi:hypothetical protein
VFAEIKSRTGLDPERDLDSIVLTSAGDSPNSGLAFAFGSILSDKIAKALGPRKDLYRKELGGETLFTYSEAGGTKIAVVLLSDHALLVGGEEAVKAVLAAAKSGAAPLRSNALLMNLVTRLRPGATVWMVGDQSLLSALPRTIPGGGSGNAPALNLPAMKSLTATFDFDPEIVFEVEAEAPDPAGAKNLGDIVRGFLALATIQAAQKPELQKLASAISVTNDQNKVLLNGRLPYELLDSLQGPARGAGPKPVPSPARP